MQQSFSTDLSKQRKDIIAKYHNGPTKNKVDDWENPQYSIYATTDYYGFIHDGGISDEFLAKESKIKKLDCTREAKWRKLLEKKSGSKTSRASQVVGFENHFTTLVARMNDSSFREELTKRVYKGIPQQFKSSLWQVFLDINKMKNNKPKVYQTMLKKALERSPDVHQIDLDVNRTFRNTTYFRERYNDRQNALLHVLSAYSMYNTEIGYCQGMSEIGGLLLMYLVEEEDVFWGLSQLMTSTRWSMHGMFVAGFPRLLTFFSHLNVILQRLLPKIHKHFEKLELMSSAYALKWFMQCFLDRVPFTLFLRVWDIYLLEGEKLLIAMAYNILKLHKKRIIKMDHCSILQFFQCDLRKDFLYEDDFVVESLKACIEELRKHKLSVPPPVQSYELPTRPFGTDQDFQTPSLAAVKERQLAQSNPEEVIRRSIKKQKKSELSSIPVNIRTPSRSGSEEKKSLTRSTSRDQNVVIKEKKSETDIPTQKNKPLIRSTSRDQNMVIKEKKSETDTPTQENKPLTRSTSRDQNVVIKEKKSETDTPTQQNKPLTRSTSRDQKLVLKEKKSETDGPVQSQIRYRVNHKTSQINKSKSLHLTEDVKLNHARDNENLQKKVNATSNLPNTYPNKSVPDLSQHNPELPKYSHTATTLRPYKPNQPTESNHISSNHVSTNSIPKSKTTPSMYISQRPSPVGLTRRPISSSPETVL